MAQAELITPCDMDFLLPLEEGDLLLGVGSGGIAAEDFPYDPSQVQLDRSLLDTRLPELGCTIGEELRKPARDYDAVLEKLGQRGLCPKLAVPIGGGLSRRITAAMPEGLSARIFISSFPVPPTFDMIAQRFQLSLLEMCGYFNMGIGMVLVIPRQAVGDVKNALCRCGERTYIIGSVVHGDAGVELV